MELVDPLQKLLEELVLFIPDLIVALIVFGVTLLLAGFAARQVEQSTKSRIKDPETRLLLARLARWTTLIVGTIVALDQVNFDITSFVAGLGIAGFTIGFALQDIARNFVAGVLLLIRQPFSVGDPISVAGYSGSVLDITTRDTVIKTWDGEMVILPNLDVFSNPITNYSKLPFRRRTVMIGLGYGEDSKRAIGIFLDAVKGVEGVLDDPAPTVRAKELGDSALTLESLFWVNQRTHDLFDVQSEVVQALNDVAQEEGIDLPYPVQTVLLERQSA